jgi:polyphosphate glucokinase
MSRRAVGVDIGGSSIKSAIVDVERGVLVGERHSVKSPAMSAIAEMLDAVAAALPPGADGLPVGVTFPGVVLGGVVHTAANVAKAWLDHPLASSAAQRLRRDVVALNDADAAGLAEITFGAAKGITGTVLILTLGTGIGSALFVDGRLVPNTEFGHLEFDGAEAEARASARVRVEKNLSWTAWTQELNYVLQRMHALLWPDLIVLCGGITEDNPGLAEQLTCRCPVKLGALRADAGVVGAALATTLSRGVWLDSRGAQRA